MRWGVTAYQGVYIGTPWIIYNDKKDPKLPPPIMEAELGFSRDGWTWKRLFPGTPFVGVGGPGSPDEKQIRMSSSLIVLDDRILLLYAMSRDVHIGDMRVQVGLATLRLDGFASMAAGETAGALETKPFLVEGTRLLLNAAADAGEVTVSVLDARGRPIPGFEASTINQDGLRLSVKWNGPRFRALAREDRAASLHHAARASLQLSGSAVTFIFEPRTSAPVPESSGS